eukprot:Clim_evm15s147 gene=Clim_evmTU15s147
MSERYSFSLTTFSPSGKLVQIEYALNAVASGATSLGVKATNGVVIATEKTMPMLCDESSLPKLVKITDTVGMVYSGIGPDSRVLAKKARKIAQEYFLTYREPMPLSQVVREVASVMQEYTQSGGVRPFGVSLLVCGLDEGRHGMFQVDPSGSYWPWKATAIGKNYVNAKTFLEKRYNEEIELEDAIHTAILTLKEGFEGQLTEKSIEIATVTPKDGFRILTEAELKDQLAAVGN